MDLSFLKKHSKIPYFFLAVFALILAGCYFEPQPVLEYRAATAKSTWVNGVELHSVQSGNLDFKVGFLEAADYIHIGEKYVSPLFFSISWFNRSKDTVLFNPENFRLVSAYKDSVLVAIDPEFVIRETKKDLAAENAQYSSELGLSTTLNLVDAGVSIISLFGNETDAEQEERNKASEKSRQDQKESEQIHKQRSDGFDNKILFWSKGVLRKTTLSPNQGLKGRIAFGLKSKFDAPDSVVLQYRERGGKFADLIPFGLIRDTVQSKKESEKKKPKPESSYF